MDYKPITLADIYEARRRIAPLIRRTYLINAPQLTKISGSNISLKLENLQVTGSFKPRGVANKLLSMGEEERRRGVVAVTTGNHGRAIAYIAQKLRVPATICISENVPDYKREAIRRYGARLVVGGKTYDQAVQTMKEISSKEGLTLIGSFEEPMITAGHGTIGIELLEDYPQVDTVLIPLAAGGLLIGISTALRASNPGVKMIGIAMDRGALLVNSLIAGKVVEFVEEPTLADALMGGLGPDAEAVFKIIQPYVDEAVTVSETEISSAMAYGMDQHHQIIEGAGAVGLAALLYGKVKQLGKHTAVIVTGGNVDLPVLSDILKNRSAYPIAPE